MIVGAVDDVFTAELLKEMMCERVVLHGVTDNTKLDQLGIRFTRQTLVATLQSKHPHHENSTSDRQSGFLRASWGLESVLNSHPVGYEIKVLKFATGGKHIVSSD